MNQVTFSPDVFKQWEIARNYIAGNPATQFESTIITIITLVRKRKTIVYFVIYFRSTIKYFIDVILVDA